MFPINSNNSSRNSYKVSPQDKDFLTISNNLGVDYKNLLAANPNISSVSTGQFISLPNDLGEKALPPAPNPSFLQNIVSAKQSYAPPPSAPVLNSGGGDESNKYGLTGGASGEYNQAKITNPLNRAAVIVEQQRLNTIATQLINKQYPYSVSMLDAKTLGISPQEFFDAGYTFYRGRYQLKNPNSNIAGSTASGEDLIYKQQNINGTIVNVTQSGVRYNQDGTVFWDPKTATKDIYGGRFKQVGEKEWRVINGKRQKVILLGGGKVITEEELRRKNRGNNRPVEIRPDAPSTTLDLVLGS